MSKWSLVESSKTKHLAISLPLILILVLSFLILLPLNPAHAVSPSLTKFYANTGFSGTTLTLFGSIVFNPSTDCGGSCVGRAVVISVYELPSTASITSITDSNGVGCSSPANTWSKIARTVSNGNGDESPIASEVWWTLVTCATSNTYWNFVISFSSSCTICQIAFYYSNQGMHPTGQFSGVPVTVSNNAVANTGIPKLNSILNSNKFTFSGSQQYLAFNQLMANQSAGGTYPYLSIASIAPLDTTGMETNNPQGVWYAADAQGVITPAGGSISQSLQMQVTSTGGTSVPNFACGFLGTLSCTTYQLDMLTVIFVQGQIQPPSCQNCGLAGGGTTKLTTTTYSLHMPNETLLYLFDSPVGGALIQNVATEIANYTNVGTGKSADFIYLCIYQLPSGVLQSKTPISSSNPLKQTGCVTINTITTGQQNQNITWSPNVEIPPTTTFAISIMSRYSGLRIWTASDNILLYGDTADYTGTAGVPPLTLSNYFTTTPPIYLYYTGSQSPIITTSAITNTSTITCLSGSTCITSTVFVTQVSTSLIYSMQGSNGAVANIQDITAFLPVWVLPLIMGVLFGVIGLLFGGVVGLGMGVMLGVIPLWFAFLLGLGIVFLLFKRVI